MKIFENYCVNIITQNPLLRKLFPCFFGILGGKEVYFYENFYSVVRNIGKNTSLSPILIIDTPCQIEHLKYYSDKFTHIPIFLLTDQIKYQSDCHAVSAQECLQAFKDFYEKIKHRSPFDNYAEIQKISPAPYKKGRVYLEDSEIEYLATLDIHIHSMTKPLTLRNISNALFEALPYEESKYRASKKLMLL